jgi:hypothetical protein
MMGVEGWKGGRWFGGSSACVTSEDSTFLRKDGRKNCGSSGYTLSGPREAAKAICRWEKLTKLVVSLAEV